MAFVSLHSPIAGDTKRINLEYCLLVTRNSLMRTSMALSLVNLAFIAPSVGVMVATTAKEVLAKNSPFQIRLISLLVLICTSSLSLKLPIGPMGVIAVSAASHDDFS